MLLLPFFFQNTRSEIKKMNEIKRGIVAFLLAAALLVSMVGMASAVNQIWLLKDSGAGACGADYEMCRGSGHGEGYVGMTDQSHIWSADEAVSVAGGVSFGTGTWTGTLDYLGEHSGGFLDPGETMTVEIGSFDGSTFTSAMTQIHSPTEPKGATFVSVAPDTGFTVPQNHCLALKLTVSGTVYVSVNGVEPGSSYIRSPSVDPGYPVPELSTLVLLSFGLLALMGYVGLKRRNNKK